ncbi:MAG: carboxypeptidase regulatory-like domain-containing protein, partial [Pseudomonas sp.]|nr:carboxypeptidase regulatory-like domain-containing protein [Pseudomonas sp.]
MSPHHLVHSTLRICLAIAGLFGLVGSAHAASFTGTVHLPDGKPAYGAMVTVFDATKQKRETVYTDEQGQYSIRTGYAGALDIRVRLANYADNRISQTVALDELAHVDLPLLPFANAMAASDALAASAHNAKLPWKAPQDRAPFVSQCNYCHQMGNSTPRVPRSHDQWIGTITKMEGILAMPSAAQKENFADVLSRGFDGKPVQALHNYGASAELARAKVEEWLIGDAMSFIHDADVMQDQKVYGTDEGHDILWVLDRKTGKIEQNHLPDVDLPRGGKFSGMALPIGVFTGKHGPHSMGETSDGRIWFTNSLSSTLMSFDPQTKAFKSYPIGHDALYPHTLRVDKNDVVWFTIVASNQMGRFDPKTETMTVIGLPHNGVLRWATDTLFPTLLRISSWVPDKALLINLSHHRFFGEKIMAFPYGIDVNPLDGSIWYAKLYASKIGRIDPQTLEITEYDTPLKGPRRPRFDAQGIFWIPAFDENALMRFDPTTKAFETYKIPAVAEGEYETPYALNVDRKTGDVW